MQLVTVFESDDPVAFSIAKSTLEDAGVEFASAEEALTGYGFSPIIHPVCRIEVAETSKGRALELIEGLSTVESEAAGDDAPRE
jgi:Putative prokaryotic signal transducing protein